MADYRDLSRRIAAALFTNGAGDHAERLVLTIDSSGSKAGRDLGGWCEEAAAGVIEAHLAELATARGASLTGGQGDNEGGR